MCAFIFLTRWARRHGFALPMSTILCVFPWPICRLMIFARYLKRSRPSRTVRLCSRVSLADLFRSVDSPPGPELHSHVPSQSSDEDVDQAALPTIDLGGPRHLGS